MNGISFIYFLFVAPAISLGTYSDRYHRNPVHQEMPFASYNVVGWAIVRTQDDRMLSNVRTLGL